MINNFSKKIAFSALKMIKYGKIVVTDYDQSKHIFGNDENLIVFVKINRSDFFKKIISKGSIGMAEAYMNNEFETDNLSKLIELTAKNIEIVHKFSGILDLSFINYLKNLFNKNTKSNSKKNISKHYDLGNEFYSHWLDNSMSYSSALFTDFGEELEVGQNRKYQRLAKALKLKEGDQVLEIGCGWGGFAAVSYTHLRAHET